MKTSDLITLMTEDQITSAPVGRTLSLALLGGAAAAALLFAVSIGVRPDIASVMQESRFLFKLLVTLTLTVAAGLLLVRLIRPQVEPRRSQWLLLIVPTLLTVGVAAELNAVPSSEWGARLIGSNGMLCMTMIPLLSIVPLIAVFYALRHAAPTRPGLCGAVTGLLCSGIAASLYAIHCNDDSPLFVAFWYSLAVAGVTLVAAGAGQRLLRW